MANIGASRVVPGANDNLSAVAGWCRARPRAARGAATRACACCCSRRAPRSRFMEGMQALRDSGTSPTLDRETTEFVCLECVGSPQLCVVEGEGMLRMRHYTGRARASALARAGVDAGVELTRGLRTVAATDGLIALRAGYPTCTARRRRRDEVPGQLPLAVGHARTTSTGTASRAPWRSARSSCGAGWPPSSSRSTRPPGRRTRAGRGCPRGSATWRSCPPWRRSARA